jgi:hypothetical protein
MARLQASCGGCWPILRSEFMGSMSRIPSVVANSRKRWSLCWRAWFKTPMKCSAIHDGGHCVEGGTSKLGLDRADRRGGQTLWSTSPLATIGTRWLRVMAQALIRECISSVYMFRFHEGFGRIELGSGGLLGACSACAPTCPQIRRASRRKIGVHAGICYDLAGHVDQSSGCWAGRRCDLVLGHDDIWRPALPITLSAPRL